MVSSNFMESVNTPLTATNVSVKGRQNSDNFGMYVIDIHVNIFSTVQANGSHGAELTTCRRIIMLFLTSEIYKDMNYMMSNSNNPQSKS